MSFLAQCPACGAQLRLSAGADNRSVRCPKCSQSFQPDGVDGGPKGSSAGAYSVEGPPPPLIGGDTGVPARRRRRPLYFEEDLVDTLPGPGLAMAATIVLLVLVGVDVVYWFFLLVALVKVLSASLILDGILVWVNAEMVILVIRAVLFVASAVLLCMWFYRAHANLRLMKAKRLDFTPGWAVGYFFIPIVNLYRPYAVAQEIWKASDPSATGAHWEDDWKDADGSYFIAMWWTCWIVSGAIATIARAFVRPPANPAAFSKGTWGFGCVLMIIATLVLLGASILLILVIRAVMRRQEKRFARLRVRREKS